MEKRSLIFLGVILYFGSQASADCVGSSTPYQITITKNSSTKHVQVTRQSSPESTWDFEDKNGLITLSVLYSSLKNAGHSDLTVYYSTFLEALQRLEVRMMQAKKVGDPAFRAQTESIRKSITVLINDIKKSKNMKGQGMLTKAHLERFRENIYTPLENDPIPSTLSLMGSSINQEKSIANTLPLGFMDHPFFQDDCYPLALNIDDRPSSKEKKPSREKKKKATR